MVYLVHVTNNVNRNHYVGKKMPEIVTPSFNRVSNLFNYSIFGKKAINWKLLYMQVEVLWTTFYGLNLSTKIFSIKMEICDS